MTYDHCGKQAPDAVFCTNCGAHQGLATDPIAAACTDGVAKVSDDSFKAVWFEILAPASSFQAFTNSIPASLFTQTTFTDTGTLS